MADEPNMVLRSVYLPPDVDDELRIRAYEKQTSMNALIRQYIEEALRRQRRGRAKPQVGLATRKILTNTTRSLGLALSRLADK